MNEPYSEEMLSAYVDGELSAQERAAIEQWLERSPEARQKLDDFRRLSSVFAGLPRTEVPQEFPVKVLQLAERRMLLPEAAAVSQRSGLRRWGWAIGVSVTAAAGLLLILQTIFRSPAELPREAVANRDNVAAPALADGTAPAEPGDELGKEGLLVARNDKQLSDEKAGTKVDAASAAAAPQTALRRESGESTRRIDPSGPGSAGQPGSAVTKANAAAQESLQLAPSSSATSLKNAAPADRRLAEINQAFDAVRDSGPEKEMVLVMKVVVDRADGMELLQGYFTDNGVLTGRDNLAGKDESVAANGRKSAKLKGVKANEALYVEAELSQVIAAFRPILAREVAGMRMEVQDPIEVAALDAGSQERLKEAKGSQPGSPVVRGMSVTKPAAAAAGGASPAGGKPAADAGPLAKSKPENTPAAEKPVRDADKNSERRSAVDEAPDAKKPGAKKPDAELADKKGIAPQSENPAKTADGPVSKEEAGRPAMPRGRQLVMPVPQAIEERVQLGGANKQANGQTDGKAKPQKSQVARQAARTPAPQEIRDQPARPTVQEVVKESPAVVRVLILFEVENAAPAAPGNAVPATKSPADGS